MAITPLQINKETSSFKTNILFEVASKNWLSILGDSSLKILILFTSLENKDEALLGDYDFVCKETGKSRGSVASGFNELEAFGFLKIKKILNKKTKLYSLSKELRVLENKWIKFFSDSNYKKICLSMLSNKSIDNAVIEKMQLEVVNSRNEDIEKTLGKLLFLFMEKKGFKIEDLLEEEIIEMNDELFKDGFGFEMVGVDLKEVWKDILEADEKKDKNLMNVLEHYITLVDYPTRNDVNLVKKALVYCYPYQIKNAILRTATHKQFADRFTSFSYIYNEVKNGRYGTRKNNKAKDKFDTRPIGAEKRVNNQTDFGFKNSGLSRAEVAENIKKQAVGTNDDNQADKDAPFDFNSLRRG